MAGTTHLASLGMQANSLRMDMTVFLIFLLCMTFPCESWTLTCSVFLCRSIPTYADGLRLVFVCCLSFFFEPVVLFMALLRFCEIFLFWLVLFLLSPRLLELRTAAACIPLPDFLANFFTCSYFWGKSISTFPAFLILFAQGILKHNKIKFNTFFCKTQHIVQEELPTKSFFG